MDNYNIKPKVYKSQKRDVILNKFIIILKEIFSIDFLNY